MIMARYISKQTNGCSNFSGSSAQSVLSFGFLTLVFPGSGSPLKKLTTENGNCAEYSPISTSDISDQL